MAFFNNKVSSRRSYAPAAAEVPIANNSSASLARVSFTPSTAGSASNPFAKKKSNPFQQSQLATPQDPGVIDMSSNPLSEEALLNLRRRLSQSDGEVVVTKLVLREADLTQQSCSFIARTLEANNSLRELDVGFNSIGSIGAAAISEMLKFNTCLTVLDLRNDKINVTGGTVLGQALIVNRALTRLRLGNNSLGDGGVSALAIGLAVNITLETLELENNDIGDAGLDELGAALDWKRAKCQLKELRLENNSIGERGVESLMTYLIENSAIESIYFTENPVSIQMLRTCGSEVNFSGNYLSPFNSIAYMMLLTSGNAPEDLIISLKLNDVCLSGLDPAGRGMRTSRPCFLLGHLSETVAFIKFKQLHLSGNNLSFLEVSALLEGLVSSTSLQILDLSRNRLDTKSSEKIISMLGDGGLCNLDRLELGDNPGLLSGPTSGTSWGELLSNPRGPRKLRRLGLANTGIRGAVEMFKQMQHSAESFGTGWPITWLDVRGNVGINAAAKNALTLALQTVTTKMLHGGLKKYINATWGLKSAWASKSASGIEGDSPFLFCSFSCDSFDLTPTTTLFSCPGAGLGVEDAMLIGELVRHHQNIKSMILDSNPAIGDMGCVALASGSGSSISLERLSLRNCGIARAGATSLVDLFKTKPGIVVRAAGGNLDIPSGLRRSLEDQEREMQFDIGAASATNGDGGAAVAVLSIPTEKRRPMGRDRMVDLKPILAPGCSIASRVCRLHVMGENGVGKRTLLSSMGRSWTASLMANEDGEDSEPPLPVLSVAPSIIIGNDVTTATWVHGDVGNLKWLQQWSDAVFIIVVNLNTERDAQERLIVHYLSRIQAAAPDNATILLVGSKSDKLGKLGKEYLARLSDSVSERLMSRAAGTHGPPPPISSTVAMDCRKSQSSGMKELRSILIKEQSRVINRMPIAVASISKFVAALLSKWAKEPWIASDINSLPTAVVSVTELLCRCRLELFGGMKMSELISILRSLQKAGAWMMLGNDNLNISDVDEMELVNAFVVLDEGWLMRQILSPLSIMSLERMTLARAHSTITNLALGSTVEGVSHISQCLISLLIAINYAVIIEDRVVFVLGAKLAKQPLLQVEEGAEEEEVALVTLASRLMVESPSGGMETLWWRMLLAHVATFIGPSFNAMMGESSSNVAGSSVDLFSDAVAFRGLDVGGSQGECMIQLVNNNAIDVMVQVKGEVDAGVLSELFTKLRDSVTEFLSQQKAIHVTLYDDLKGSPNTWRCLPEDRVAIRSNRPPSPVFIRKQSSIEPAEEVSPVEEEETHVLSSNGEEEGDKVWYRDNWSVLDDLDNDRSVWGGGCRRNLLGESKVAESLGSYEIMIPHPKSVKLSSSLNTSSNVEMSKIAQIVDVATAIDESASTRCVNAVGSSVVVSCLSTWESHLLDLVGMTVTYVSDVPFDKGACEVTMDTQAVDTALETLTYPLYLTIACDDENAVVNEPRALKLLLLCTTRQTVEHEGEWRMTGDQQPGPVSWRLVAVEFNPKSPSMGVDNTVKVEDFRVVASYALSDTLAQKFVAEHAEAKRLGSGIEEEESIEAMVYVHGFLTPLCNAIKSAAIYGRCFNRLVICFSWPCDPQLVNHSWIVTKVMSEFERNYTQAEQHMHGSIRHLVGLARVLPSWGVSPVWKAHSMGNYLLLNAVDRLCWLNERVTDQSVVGTAFKKLILDAPDVPTWFFDDIVNKAVNIPHSCSVLHLFNPLDTAVEAGRQRRAIQGAYPGNALVISSMKQAGGGSLQVVSCEGARAASGSHDYGQMDGFCLLDQRDFLDGKAPHQRLLDAVQEGAEDTRTYPIFWKLKIG